MLLAAVDFILVPAAPVLVGGGNGVVFVLRLVFLPLLLLMLMLEIFWRLLLVFLGLLIVVANVVIVVAAVFATSMDAVVTLGCSWVALVTRAPVGGATVVCYNQVIVFYG